MEGNKLPDRLSTGFGGCAPGLIPFLILLVLGLSNQGTEIGGGHAGLGERRLVLAVFRSLPGWRGLRKKLIVQARDRVIKQVMTMGLMCGDGHTRLRGQGSENVGAAYNARNPALADD